MIVDCHTHMDIAEADTEQTGHLEAAQTVDKCIVLATADDSSEKVNEALAQYVGKYEDKLIGFALIDPRKDDIVTKKVASMTVKAGLKGVVLYCSGCGFHPAHSRAMRFYESAEELGLPVFFHNGGVLDSKAVLDYAKPYLLDEIARKFPDLKIVIGTMGVPFGEQTLSMIAKHENVYADLTINPNCFWQVYNMVVAAHERTVMDKLLFGSGYPQSNSGACIERLLGFNKLFADTNLPTVPRGSIQKIIERDTLELLAIKD